MQDMNTFRLEVPGGVANRGRPFLNGEPMRYVTRVQVDLDPARDVYASVTVTFIAALDIEVLHLVSAPPEEEDAPDAAALATGPD